MDKQAQCLEEIFKHNNNVGMAIAITGSWGVGKTHFWNGFIESRVKKEKATMDSYHYRLASLSEHKAIFNKKYAYVSLFGVESLSDLKTQIYTQLNGPHFSAKDQPKFEVPRWMKAIASGLKDEKFSQWGFSVSMRFFDAMLFGQIKNTIICFDDFERMSNKLDIKDVMGLANQLKLEKKCQVVLILDETKTEGENKNKYAEYKEKLIDEVIKITSVEHLLRDRAKAAKIDDELIDLMVKFAEELDIHNFRFFQKVIKLYKKFREQLPQEVVYSTKEIILIRILQGYFIEDFGEIFGINWNDFSLSNALIRRQKQSNLKVENKIDSIFTKLEKISFKLTLCEDTWSFEFKKWFSQRGEVDFEILKELAQSDFISDEKNLLKDHLQDLMTKWRNLEVDENYCESLFTISSKLVAIESLGILELSAELLKKFGKPELSKRLKRLTISGLKSDLETDAIEIYEKHLRFPMQHVTIFHRYIKLWRTSNPLKGLPSLLDVLKAELKEGVQLRYAEEVIKNSKESDWEKFIFEDALIDPELRHLNRAQLIDKILKNPNLRSTSSSSLKAKMINILESRMNKFDSYATKENYKFVIENFKKEGLL